MSFEVIHRGYDQDGSQGHITVADAVSGRTVSVKVRMPRPEPRPGETATATVERAMLDVARTALRDALDYL